MAKLPKKLKGRLKEAKHLDVVEVKWIDATSTSGWQPVKTYCQTLLCHSVGYFDGVYDGEDGKPQLHIYGDRGFDNKTIARCHGVPIENIREFRIVSKGKQ